jgi:hypothetical protein
VQHLHSARLGLAQHHLAQTVAGAKGLHRQP